MHLSLDFSFSIIDERNFSKKQKLLKFVRIFLVQNHVLASSEIALPCADRPVLGKLTSSLAKVRHWHEKP